MSVPADLSPYIDGAPDAIVIADQHGVIRRTNHQAEVLFGYPQSEMVGQPVEMLLPTGFADAHVGLRSRFFAHPSRRPMADPASAVRARCADGSEVPVDVALSPVTIDEETTVMAVVRDVTIRAGAESLLRSSEQYYRAAFDRAPLSVVVFDQSGTDSRPILDVNAALTEMLGYQRRELLEMDLADLVHPADHGVLATSIEPAGPGQTLETRTETRYLHADGHTVWGETRTVTIAGELGDRTGLSQILNITRRVAAERERDRRELLLRVLADLRMEVLEGKSRTELLNFVALSLMGIHEGTFAAVLLTGEDSLRMVSYATADGVVDPPARTIPLNTGLSGLFANDQAQVFPGPGPGTPTRVRDWLSGTSEVLLAPVKISESVDGILVAGRPEGARPFDETDREVMMIMARDTAIALALRRSQRNERRMLVTEDRERIARDLHDVVIQRIFSVGMRLQSALTDPDTLPGRAGEAIDELDQTIAVIRETIFDLAGDDPWSRLSSAIEAHEAARSIDFEVATSGDFTDLSDDMIDTMISFVDETLTNILRHASASEAEVHVGVSGDRASVTVGDNGVGLGVPAPGGRGLDRLRAQASELGGSVSVGVATLGGVEVRWDVPLRS